MSLVDRRNLLLGGGAAALAAAGAARALAQSGTMSGHEHHGGLYESLQKPGRIGLPEVAATQHVIDSPAPKAANPGRWMTKAPLPLPRSEMAWATAHADKMHLVGGYGEQRVDRPYHQVYDPAATTGAMPRRCRAAPTTSASPCSTAGSTRSAASSSRTASRTTSASCSMPAATPGAGSHRCRAPAAPSPAWRSRAGCTRSAARSATPSPPRSRWTGTSPTIPRPTTGRSARRCRPAATIPARSPSAT